MFVFNFLFIALARSCSDLKKLDPTRESGDYTIDPDGEGGIYHLTSPVTCLKRMELA